jgi:hypothetical protein
MTKHRFETDGVSNVQDSAIGGLQLLANSPQERRKRSPDEHSDNRGIVRQRPRISLGFIRAKA